MGSRRRRRLGCGANDFPPGTSGGYALSPGVLCLGVPTLDHILSDSGPVARLLGVDFEPRPQQLEMARGVAEAMEAGTHLMVEAGTGVGKSFAYLVPAVLRCLTRGEIVVIATNTISLQEQLIEKDIPLLQRVVAELEESGDPLRGPDGLKRELKPVLVKGRGNYVSIRRMGLAHERRDRLFSEPSQRRTLDQIRDWAMTTKDGTISTLPQLERGGVWDKVQSDSGNCMGRKCRNYNDCFYQKARRELDGANLLICNHAMFFSDLAAEVAGGWDSAQLPACDSGRGAQCRRGCQRPLRGFAERGSREPPFEHAVPPAEREGVSASAWADAAGWGERGAGDCAGAAGAGCVAGVL